MRGKRNMKEDATISHLLEEQFQHRKLPASVLQDQAAVAEQRATCWRDRGGSSVCGKSPPRKTNKSSSLLSLKLVFKNKNKINAHGIKLFILRLKKRNLKKQYSKF